MITLTGKRLVQYERLMRRASDESFEMPEDYLCRGCAHHRPEWEYRFCKYPECPYFKGQKTFWEGVYQNGR